MSNVSNVLLAGADMENVGKLFAESETSADLALDQAARLLGDSPSWDLYSASRVSFVAGYVTAKPQAKGESADQAWKRFKDRLVLRYAITVPQAPSKAAIKKRAERTAKQDSLLKQYEAATPAQLTDMLRKQYEQQAKDPSLDDRKINEIKQVLKMKTKDQKAEQDKVLKDLRSELSKLVKDCTDAVKIKKAISLLK